MVILLVIACVRWTQTHRHSPGGSPGPSPGSGGADDPVTVMKPICSPPILGFQTPEPPMDNPLSFHKADRISTNAVAVEKGNAIIRDRKKRAGIDKSLDLIVRPDEWFTIGDITVSMRDILARAAADGGNPLEEEIHTSGQITVDVNGEYGIYVVQSGDNIWNIHFKIIQEYFGHRGVTVIKTADEPMAPGGKSSGVGKLLKFSEKMVIIYDLLKGSIASDLDLVEPLSKVVVYNMHEIFFLLQEIDYDNVDNIRFDGNTIWIPAEQQP